MLSEAVSQSVTMKHPDKNRDNPLAVQAFFDLPKLSRPKAEES
jgi:hypothetical protein